MREQQRGFTCENCELCRSQAGLAVGEEGLRLMQGGVRNHRAWRVVLKVCRYGNRLTWKTNNKITKGTQLAIHILICYLTKCIYKVHSNTCNLEDMISENVQTELAAIPFMEYVVPGSLWFSTISNLFTFNTVDFLLKIVIRMGLIPSRDKLLPFITATGLSTNAARVFIFQI